MHNAKGRMDTAENKREQVLNRIASVWIGLKCFPDRQIWLFACMYRNSRVEEVNSWQLI